MYIDIFLLILFVWAVVNGWLNGFIKEALNTLGIITGLAIAAIIYATLGKHLALEGYSQLHDGLSIITFLLACVIVPLALGFVANILTIAVNNPLTGMPNHILGSCFSVAKFLLLISFAFNMMSGIEIISKEDTEKSVLYTPVTKILPFVRSGIATIQDNRRETPMHKEKGMHPDTTFIDFAPAGNHKI